MMGMRNFIVICSLILILTETITAAPVVIGRDDIIVEKGKSRDVICTEPVEMGVSHRITIIWSVRRNPNEVGVDVIGYKDGRHLTYDQDLISHDRMKLRDAGRKLTITSFQLSDNEFKLYCNIYTEVSRWEGSSTIQVFTYAHNEPQVLKGGGVFYPGLRKIGACTSGFAYPAPDIKIFQDGTEIGQDFAVKKLLRDEYQVTTVKVVEMNVSAADHNSEIRCQIFSGIPPRAHPGKAKLLSRIRVQHELTKIEVTSSNRKGYYNVGEVVTFRCKYDGWPHGAIISFGPDYSRLSKIEVTITEDMHGQSINCTVLGTLSGEQKTAGLPIILKSYLDEVHIAGPNIIDVENVQHLYCIGEGRPEPDYQWYLNGELLSKGANLTLEKGGNYSCTSTNAAGKQQSPYHVVEMPEPKVILQVIAEADSTVTLPCKVDILEEAFNVDADYEVTWSAILTHSNSSTHILTFESAFANSDWGSQFSEHFFTMSTQNGNELLIDPAQSSDSGLYECRVVTTSADGRMETVETARINLEVREFYETWENPEEEVMVAAGDTVTMECPVVAHPHPHFTWTREDGDEGPRQVVSGGNVEIDESWDYIQEVHTQTTSKLTILFGTIDEDFSAIYKCHVENVVGSEEKKFQLTAAEVEWIQPTTQQMPQHEVMTQDVTTSFRNPTTTMTSTTRRAESNTRDEEKTMNTTRHYDVTDPETTPSPTPTTMKLATTKPLTTTPATTTPATTTPATTTPATTALMTTALMTTTPVTTTPVTTTPTTTKPTTTTPVTTTTVMTTPVTTTPATTTPTTTTPMTTTPVTTTTVTTTPVTTTPMTTTPATTTTTQVYTSYDLAEEQRAIGIATTDTTTVVMTSPHTTQRDNVATETTERAALTPVTAGSTTFAEGSTFTGFQLIGSLDEGEGLSKVVTVTFHENFSSVTAVNAWTEGSQKFSDTFQTTVSNLTRVGFTATIQRTDVVQGWGQNPALQWIVNGTLSQPDAEDDPLTSCRLQEKEEPSSPTRFKNGKSRFKFSVYRSKSFVPRDRIFFADNDEGEATIVIKALKTPGKSRGKKRRRSSIGRSVKISQVDVYTFHLLQDNTQLYCDMDLTDDTLLDTCDAHHVNFKKAKRRVKVKIPINPLPQISHCPLIVRLKITSKDGRIFYDEIEDRHLNLVDNFAERPLSLVVRDNML